MKKNFLISLLLLSSIFFSPASFCKTPPWSFRLSPYFWVPGLSGHVNIRGTRVNFSSVASQVWPSLDSSFGLRFEAQRDPWSLLLDPDYIKITQHPALLGINGKASYETTITDAGAYYNITPYLPCPPKKKPGLTLELLGAARIATFHTVISTLQTTVPPSISDTSSFVVPVIGARLQLKPTPKVQLWLSGDFGGFQMTHVSSTWGTSLGIRYQLTPRFDLSLAYRFFSVNYSKQAITISTQLQGPVFACGFSW